MADERAAGDPDRQYVLVSTNGHSYVFCYQSGHERELYFTLIDCARDPDSELGWPEVLVVMQQVGAFPPDLPFRQ